MSHNVFPQERLKWTGGWDSEPIWPREPDVSVIKSLAKQHLRAKLPTPFDDASPEISFFAAGGFNKLYLITYRGHPTKYLFRVALAIEPYYKTESEVATIAYLRANTTIPVPRILAWDSCSDNNLTFEWILMEKIDGVPLWDVWRKVPWERKLELTETIAGMVKQLRDCTFDRLGGLYFASAVDNTARKTLVSDSKPINTAVERKIDAGVSSEVSRHDEDGGIPDLQKLNINTPCTAESEPLTFILQSTENAIETENKTQLDRTINKEELVAAVTELTMCRTRDRFERLSSSIGIENVGSQESEHFITSVVDGQQDNQDKNPTNAMNEAEFSINRMFDSLFFIGSRLYLPGDRGPYRSSIEWIRAEIHVNLEWIKNGPVEEDEDYGSDFGEEARMMEEMCNGYLDVLETVYGNENKTSFTLHHHDLNSANILVHPETFEVTGIVDWEMINVVPEWLALDYPRLLQDMDPMDEEEPPIPSYEDEDDSAVLERDRWDKKILRRHFDEVMKRLNQGADDVESRLRTKAMRDCYEHVSQLTGEWNWCRMWLKTYRQSGLSKNGVDRAKEVYGENDSDVEDDDEASKGRAD